VTDGGLETDLIFNRGIDLPEFASFPLVEDADGAKALAAYYRDYVTIAGQAGAGLLLETPTWRSNPDWGLKLGYDAQALDRVNRAAVALMRQLGEASGLPTVRLSGVVGPRGDGYVAVARDPDEAADYHAAQINAFATEGADVVHALTMTEVGEAIGVVRAARAAGVPVGVSFTVETDGRLPDGMALKDAITAVDAAAAPDWFGINCAHPVHIRDAFDGGEWQTRLTTLRPNASTLTHAELDVMEELDSGDQELLARTAAELRELVPSLTTIGGCCGTDASHVARLWQVPAP
jgi:S-methylmethionine-dependent homocysteine/selenocysteine methylase